jgi:glycosyltransferase involved in cell wall biosynthesis
MANVPGVSIVLPAFRLGPVIAANAARVARSCAGLDAQIIVVDDGSDDDTFQQAMQAAKEVAGLEVIRHPRNLGKGEALVSGWKAAGADRIVFLDGDLDLPPEQIPEVLAELERSDVVVGAKRRTMQSGGYPLFRRMMSRLYAEGTSRLFGLPVHETQTGLKAFRREVLDDILPRVGMRGWAFDLELLVRAFRSGYTMSETPVTVSISDKGAPVRPSMIWALARDSVKLAWKLRH